MSRFKVILAGDGGVGKSAFVKRHRTGEFEKKYIATMGVEVNPINFQTNQGNQVLNIWEVAGQEKFSGLGSGYFCKADAAVVMFDVTSPLSYSSADKWIQNIRSKCPNIPIVLCGNKIDCISRRVKPEHIRLHRKYPGLQYYDISAKSNYNFEKPWLSLLRQLLNEPNLVFVEKQAVMPPEVNVDSEQLARWALEANEYQSSSSEQPPSMHKFDTNVSLSDKSSSDAWISEYLQQKQKQEHMDDDLEEQEEQEHEEEQEMEKEEDEEYDQENGEKSTTTDMKQSISFDNVIAQAGMPASAVHRLATIVSHLSGIPPRACGPA